MMRLIILLLATLPNYVWADEGVEITDPDQVSELLGLQEKLDSVSTAIMGCLDSGEDHKACMCKHKGLIIRFNARVRELFEKNPDYETLDLVRFRAPDGMWVSQSLKNIQKQASAEPQCA